MVQYDLSHLTQDATQEVAGPIQDDEALFLFAMIRCMRLERILEIGGLGGYSASNFCRAMVSGELYTVDLYEVPTVSDNHYVIQKDCSTLTADDFDHKALDLVFFDAHAFDAQMTAYETLSMVGIIDNQTIIALHDTNLHPVQTVPWAYAHKDGYVHQDVERQMVTALKRQGYDAFSLHPKLSRHSDEFPYRHGLTILQRYKELTT